VENNRLLIHIFLAIHLIFYIGVLILQEEEEVAAPQAVQTSFTVKLHKFDADKKVAIIKEIKNLVEGMNLVQAKKFIESCPAVVKADIAKDEAEKIKAALAAVGGEVTVE
jgi:large subunit ribosomal protein L7/L12